MKTINRIQTEGSTKTAVNQGETAPGKVRSIEQPEPSESLIGTAVVLILQAAKPFGFTVTNLLREIHCSTDLVCARGDLKKMLFHMEKGGVVSMRRGKRGKEFWHLTELRVLESKFGSARAKASAPRKVKIAKGCLDLDALRRADSVVDPETLKQARELGAKGRREMGEIMIRHGKQLLECADLMERATVGLN